MPGALQQAGAPSGDTRALAGLLHQAESDAAFYARLVEWCAGLMPLVEPARERAAWEKLLGELAPPAQRRLRGAG